ncbi:hypothetical protein [Limnochorda pilosa]|uniref:Uncharacterized protein n=1 Tax=Limnochorda pilosa TaxID=1555112 RepID=A0A0K2SJ83_LIMPI|nr:hypothetical protein [Limnochorda pilosa]BAS27097.1 hypothetical protein LIP_1240 [Limnochorda pilosa]
MLTRLFHELSGLVTRLLRYAAVILGAGSGTPLCVVCKVVVVVINILRIGDTVAVRIRRRGLTIIVVTIVPTIVAIIVGLVPIIALITVAVVPGILPGTRILLIPGIALAAVV